MSQNNIGLQGLTAATAAVFDKVSRLDCIRDMYLVGGTSVSLQIGHRLSEDLDFEILGTTKERPELNFQKIITEVNTIFPGSIYEPLGDSHFLMTTPEGVKFSFFRPDFSVPYLTTGFAHNNLKTLTPQQMLGDKIFTTTLRSTFRDYYDIYCLIESGCSLSEGITYALDLSRHRIHTKELVAKLTTPQLFVKEDDFNDNLKPLFPNIDSQDIWKRIISEMEADKNTAITVTRKGSAIEVTTKETVLQLDGISSPREGFYIVKKDGKFNYLSEKGVILCNNWLDSAGMFQNGIARCSLGGRNFDISKEGIVLSVNGTCETKGIKI